MSYAQLVENKIREALAKGEFDNLPGRGRPLDLAAYFNTPEELRLGYAMLKSAGFVPLEVELQREIEALQAEHDQPTDPPRQDALRREIEAKTLKLKLLYDSHQWRR
ncbi:MAG: DUF1992 domain-containing protein [Acidobacteria bacterium]|nr:DUF1992 domain-containing protein [Acidobacteriota bacterium]MBI3421828.1 DUF1992 domain-containing protein [Acidobacteriota bacterium]